MDWKITDNKNWQSLHDQFSWIRDMQYVAQDPVHHAEGNVAIHTQMVLEQLQHSKTYQRMSIQRQGVLWAAALLHDVEKRSTTLIDAQGRISSPGHARKGAQTARQILFRDVETPFVLREEIVALVHYHGLPIWLLDKVYPMKRALQASLQLDMAELKLLAEADVKGRVCQDQRGLLEALELFELYVKEQACWHSPRVFTSSNARFTYFNREEGYVDYVPFDRFRSTVIVLSGLPGMGKDHYISTLPKDVPIISLDDIRRKHCIDPTDRRRNGWVVQQAKEQAKGYLRRGQNFVWNATNITSMMRKQLIDLFVSYQAYIKLVYIERPYDQWRNQNNQRAYPLSEVVLDKMLHNLEVPLLTEAHEVLYVVD